MSLQSTDNNMPPSTSSNSHHASVKMPSEPDLSVQVESGADRLVLRNIIYTAWSIFNSPNSSSSSSGGYTKWNVERVAEGRGYLLLMEFGRGFQIGLNDMQLLHDVCPLRIDSVFVRGIDGGDREGGCTLCISLLNSEQPVHMTESDVVRIRKRSRGLLSDAFFSSFLKKPSTK